MKKKIIVDVDAGSDDAMSLILLIAAHKMKKIELKAITCVAGNTSLNHVIKNVFRTLQACDAPEIPVYKGAHSPLITVESEIDATEILYHGTDGFGDVFKDEVDISRLEKDHAVIALRNIITENPDEISVVCLGPMTNIALAIKMYPEILDDVRDFYVMGGNSAAMGNTTSQAEFNFYFDPESVHIVLGSNRKPFWLVPWETCLKSDISIDWRQNVLGKLGTKTTKLMNCIDDGITARHQSKSTVYRPCDAFLTAVVINSSVIKKVIEFHADIELAGTKTRGQLVLDHLKRNKPNVLLIDNIDFKIFQELLLSAFDMSYEPNTIRSLK